MTPTEKFEEFHGNKLQTEKVWGDTLSYTWAKKAWLEQQKEIDKLKRLIKILSNGLDDYWVTLPENKAYIEELQKLLEKVKNED